MKLMVMSNLRGLLMMLHVYMWLLRCVPDAKNLMCDANGFYKEALGIIDLLW